MADEFDQLKAEEAAKVQAAFYENLEEKIMVLRSKVHAQAELLGQMDLSMITPFLLNVLALESLQVKYDEWEEE